MTCHSRRKRRGKPWPLEYHDLIRTPPDRYFRMGVSLLNLAYMRSDEYFQANREKFLREQLPIIDEVVRLSEQSLFNYFFSHAAVALDLNLFGASPDAGFTPDDEQSAGAKVDRLAGLDNVVLDLKGWLNYSPFDCFYWCYLMMTPWRHEAYQQLARQMAAAKRTQSATKLRPAHWFGTWWPKFQQQAG